MTVRRSAIWNKRLKTGLSRERAAALLDPPVSSKTIERWETGKTTIPGWRKAQLESAYDAAIRVAA